MTNDLDLLRQRLRVRQMQVAAMQRQQTPDAMRTRVEAALAAGEAGISPASRAGMERANAQAQQGIDQAMRAEVVQARPIGARLAVAAQGVPFAGEYTDELAGLLGGAQARDTMRAAQQGMDENHPLQALGLRVGAGIASTAPVAALAAPRIMQGTTLMGNAVRGAAVGAGAGAAEGVVSGFGAGTEGQRGQSAVERGIVGGALGGAIGGAAPLAAAGVRNLLARFRTSDVQTIAREFGVSPEAARVVRQALDAEDFAAAEAALNRAGPRAMLADAGDATRTLLDASMTGSARAARVGGDAIDARATTGGQEFTQMLDRYFGRPQGVETARTAIRTETSAARRAAYDAAYAQPIDYAARAGRRLEALWSRVPSAARQRAARLMQVEGLQSQQIMAQIAPDGSVMFSRPADVRTWDYITRALNDMAESGDARGAMGGMTAESRALTGLSRQIRDTLRSSVSGYRAALREASDTIGRTRAVEVGASLLRPSTTREQAREAIRGMTAAERTAARSGLRSYIDDLMARTRQTLTDPNMDAREAISAWRALSSRQAQDNIAALMGPARARGFASEVDRIATDFELRAAVAANSRTAVRQAVQGEVRQIAAPGLLDTIAETGSPSQGLQRLIQAMTGSDPGARAAREAGLFAEITRALTRTHGSIEARRIMQGVQQSMIAQPISEDRARSIARAVTAVLGTGAYQTGTQSLATR